MTPRTTWTWPASSGTRWRWSPSSSWSPWPRPWRRRSRASSRAPACKRSCTSRPRRRPWAWGTWRWRPRLAESAVGTTVRAFLGLGSNLGDRLGALRAAVDLLAAVPGVRVVRSSRVYETEPVGPRQPDYLNAVVEVATVLSPRELLDACLEVERRLGRVRRERWGPRTIDVDVLTYGDREVDEPGLEVPHPRMHERGFVLAPLLELAADPMLPGGRRVATLRPGPGSLRGIRPFAPPLPAPAGRPGGGPGILGAMDVAVIGAGRVGIALAVLLARAGHHIVAVSG